MCTLVDLRPLAKVAFTLFISVIVYGPTHCALCLHDLPRRTVSSKKQDLISYLYFRLPCGFVVMIFASALALN